VAFSYAAYGWVTRHLSYGVLFVCYQGGPAPHSGDCRRCFYAGVPPTYDYYFFVFHSPLLLLIKYIILYMYVLVVIVKERKNVDNLTNPAFKKAYRLVRAHRKAMIKLCASPLNQGIK
jgi:hypothetical protein